jgi:hypothetical protein
MGKKSLKDKLNSLNRRYLLPILIALNIDNGWPLVDNALFYNRGLQTPAQIERVIEKSSREKKDVAILVSGVGATQNRTTRAAENISDGYYALKARGFSDDKIIILSNSVPRGRNIQSGITARPTKENLRRVIEYASESAGDDQTITFYFVGHGSRRKNQSRICLGNSTIGQKELYALFKGNKAKKVLLFESCYSGGFVKTAKELRGDKTIIACSKEDEKALNWGLSHNFWENILKGEEVTLAYKNALESSNKDGAKSYGKNPFYQISGRPINCYQVYESKKVDIPKLNQRRSRFGNLQGLEKKVPIIMAIVGGLLIFLSNSSNSDVFLSPIMRSFNGELWVGIILLVGGLVFIVDKWMREMGSIERFKYSN